MKSLGKISWQQYALCFLVFFIAFFPLYIHGYKNFLVHECLQCIASTFLAIQHDGSICTSTCDQSDIQETNFVSLFLAIALLLFYAFIKLVKKVIFYSFNINTQKNHKGACKSITSLFFITAPIISSIFITARIVHETVDTPGVEWKTLMHEWAITWVFLYGIMLTLYTALFIVLYMRYKVKEHKT